MSLRSIEIATAQGVSVVSVAEFLALPLDERVKHVLARSVRFFDESGELPLKEGMRLLRETSADSSASNARVAPEPASPAPKLNLQDFIALPLEQRLKLVLEGRVRLYDERGIEVPLKEALQRGRDARSAR
jgi:hypothetical protein